MTPRSLFLIVLKIMGLLMAWQLLEGALQVATALYSLLDGDLSPVLPFVFLVLVPSALMVVICYLLLFRSHRIIDRLHLDKNFSEQAFSFRVSFSDVLTSALIIISGVILIKELPLLCRFLYGTFHAQYFRYAATDTNYAPLVYSIVRILIALLLVGERKRIVRFIERRHAAKEEEK